MENKIFAGFGEVMLRLAPLKEHRFAQVLPGQLNATFGGGEANVCASIAMLGKSARYLTALPDNPIVRAFANQMRGLGVDINSICYSAKGRLGVYYAEHGSNMRGSNVIYDRDYTTISLLSPEEYDFAAMLKGVNHLHLSGITPALSENAYRSTLAIAEYASQKNITISIDLNFRKKLWNWKSEINKKELAHQCMEKIVTFADIIIGNEEDAADVFGIQASHTKVEAGKLNIKSYSEVAFKLSQRFPKAKFVAITLRESISANHNNWGGMLYDCTCKKAFFAPIDEDETYAPYEIKDIADRFGGGDSFCAGLLVGLELYKPKEAIRFAVAASALKHTISGDFNYSSRDEVITLMNGNSSGRVKR
ncbi:MAG: sugar kinase [Lentisphaeria bacterium]